MTKAIPEPIPYYLMKKIRQGVITGRYPPGSALREQQLEAEYGTSRGPLREALRLLQLRGLVTHEPRRGFRVREYSAQLIEQIYRLRAVLERHAVEALAGKPLDGLIAELVRINQAMSGHFQSRSIEAYLESNIAFHDAIMATANNEPLQKVIEPLNEMAQPVRFLLLTKRFENSTALDEHAKLIELLSQGDLKAAAVFIENHVIRNIDSAAQLYPCAPSAASA
jgi:DNA-binding GntR family transcriptional regulator